jgi:hypothetical protein
VIFLKSQSKLRRIISGRRKAGRTAKIYATGIWLLLNSHRMLSPHNRPVSQNKRKLRRSLLSGQKRNRQLLMRPWLGRRKLGVTDESGIILKQEERERLLRSTAENSPASSVLTHAQSDSRQPELVAMMCDEIAAADLLKLAQQHCGSTWRAINWQMRRLGMLASSFGETKHIDVDD